MSVISNAVVEYQSGTISPLLERLLKEPYPKIINSLDPTGSFEPLNYPLPTRNVQNMDKTILPALYKKHLARYPRVRDLDMMPGHQFCGDREELSPEGIHRRLCILDKALDIAKISNGLSTIVTVPSLTLNDVERLSKEAVAKRILSARIEYFCRRELLENTSINKSTFVISNQVIKGSRGQTTEDLKALLKDKGLKDFPGTLEVLASILITLMRTEGKKGMYENHYTYTKETLPGENAEDRHLRVGLFPEDSIDVLCRGIMGDVGVGAFVSYDLLPPAPSVEESESLDLQ